VVRFSCPSQSQTLLHSPGPPATLGADDNPPSHTRLRCVPVGCLSQRRQMLHHHRHNCKPPPTTNAPPPPPPPPQRLRTSNLSSSRFANHQGAISKHRKSHTAPYPTRASLTTTSLFVQHATATDISYRVPTATADSDRRTDILSLRPHAPTERNLTRSDKNDYTQHAPFFRSLKSCFVDSNPPDSSFSAPNTTCACGIAAIARRTSNPRLTETSTWSLQ
jgi:hypothetical protein